MSSPRHFYGDLNMENRLRDDLSLGRVLNGWHKLECFSFVAPRGPYIYHSDGPDWRNHEGSVLIFFATLLVYA